MRIAALRTVVVAAIGGAAAGVLVALAGNGWVSRDAPNNIGYQAYDQQAPDTITVRTGLADTWWQLLWPAALTGLLVGAIAGLVVAILRNGVRRVVLVAGALGMVVGLAVAGVLSLRAGVDDDTSYHGRYVAFQDVEAYNSTLTVTFADKPGVGFFVVCAAAGLAAGLLTAGVITIARRRGMSRGSAGAA